jgi:hypothetical protein
MTGFIEAALKSLERDSCLLARAIYEPETTRLTAVPPQAPDVRTRRAARRAGMRSASPAAGNEGRARR